MKIDVMKLRARGIRVEELHDQNGELVEVEITVFVADGTGDVWRRASATVQKAAEHFPELGNREADELMDEIMERIDRKIVLTYL